MPVKYRLGDIVSPRVAPQEPLAVQAAHMLNCIRTGAAPRTDGESGLAVARVLEAANTALHSGREVPLIERGSDRHHDRTDAAVRAGSGRVDGRLASDRVARVAIARASPRAPRGEERAADGDTGSAARPA